MRLRKRWLVVGATAVVVIGGGVGALAATSGSSASAAQDTVDTVATTTIRQTVSATGTLASAAEADLSFASSGQVTAVAVKAGQTVTKGQPLAAITSASLSASVANAQVQVATAQNRLTTDADAAASAEQISADQQSLTVAQDSLTDAQAALANATMTSPIAGVVASVDLTVGQQVAGSTSSGSMGSGGAAGGGTPATGTSTTASSTTAQIVIIDPVHFTVATSLDATQIGQVKTGLQATITPNGSTDVVYGTVSSVGLIASSTSGVTTYPVTVSVTGEQPTLHAGSSATVSIVVKQLSDVLAVPTAAIHYEGSTARVTKVVGGSRVETDVTVGIASGLTTQITKGVAAGDKVIVSVTAGRARTEIGGTGGTGGFGGGTGRFGGGFGGGTGGFGGGNR